MDNTIGNDSKPWDKDHIQLFHRINSDQFDGDKSHKPASGKGYDCGCRSPKSDFSPAGITSSLASALVGVVFDALLALIPVVGPALLALKETVLTVLHAEGGPDFEKALGELLAREGEGFLFGNFLRSIPAWVPVDRDGYGPKFNNPEGKEVEREVEGILTRSFQTSRDMPFFQWSHWYHWSFQVRPIDGYGYMLGEGNIRNQSERDKTDSPSDLEEATDINGLGRTTGNLLHSMECLIDVGAFSKPPGDLPPDPRDPKGFRGIPGIMFHPGWPFWPMTSDCFWATGRWVYACTHSTSLDKEGENAGLMPTQLNPCKAIAFASYEGFKFDENDKLVPAVRFLFFACRKGGYLNFGDKADTEEKEDTCSVKFNDKDYEFIVDLPEPPNAAGAWPIGHTPEFLLNTVVLRPHLLVKVEFAPFQVPQNLSDPLDPKRKISNPFLLDSSAFDQSVQPIIELLKPEAPGVVPNQVKVTIPLSKVDKSKDAYGVCISLGWSDGDGNLADRVKKVTVRFDNVRFLEKTGVLYFKICLNSRWFYAPLQVQSKIPIPLTGNPSDPHLIFFVPDDARIRITSHGMKRNGYGEFFEKSDPDRTLHVGGIFRVSIGELKKEVKEAIDHGSDVLQDANGRFLKIDYVNDLLNLGPDFVNDFLTGERKEVKWKTHVDPVNKKPVAAKDKGKIDTVNQETGSAVAREMFVLLPVILANLNEPLGMVEPVSSSTQPSTTFDSNPTPMAALIKKLKDGGQKQLVVELNSTAAHIEVAGDADMLAFNNRIAGPKDYGLKCVLTVESQ